ncbi:hypothetical protein JTE90_021316 [Oedothorax gibbosus]|uniref:CIP2A N-terminal domain-containing protein n=1 Tax=Oedothorax gibbosus TaxID=931172 RepID=A0AAV6VN56_9ARAC|nr:hypothetical protein JTE90_021316 [Oedothorax gibbosus]
MDANNIVTAFVTSANQYTVNQTDDNLKQLQRHLEILVCLTSEECNLSYFQNRTLLSSQCITHVINVLLDASSKHPLLSRALSVLQNLLKNPHIFKTLQTTFHLQSALSTFMQNYGMSAKDPLVLLCLQILEKVTYDVKIDYIEHHFENFIKMLLTLIESESAQAVQVYLHILSNICRKNPKVQSFLCSLPNLKQIVKKLISFLNSVPSIILYSLSILLSITPYNSFGTRLWTDDHLTTTFDLIGKLMFCDDDSCVATALDLFVDLTAVKKNQLSFVKSPSLVKCLKKMCKSISEETSMKRAVLYLRFFLTVAEVPEAFQKLCSVLCVPSPNKDSGDSSQSFNIHPILVEMCAVNCNEGAPLRENSLKLVQKLLGQYNNGNFCYIEESVKLILQGIFESMQGPSLTKDQEWEGYLKAQLAVFDILAICCSSESLKIFISHHLNIHLCEEVAKFVLDKCSTDNSLCYESSVDLFLMIVEVILGLETSSVGIEQALERMLENSSAMQCLSYALTSSNNELITRAVRLMSQSKGNFSVSLLSESLLMRNVNLHRSASQSSESSSQNSFTSDFMPSAPKKPHLSRSSGKSVDFLLSKIENGLQIKDLKSSEIMDLYEHKIAMLTLKEQELQSYVDAKTAALQEADRLITQYKCRQSDADTEALRLRSMMKEYEQRSEQYATQLQVAEQKHRKTEANFLEARQKLKEMEQQQNEQKDMATSQLNRLNEQKRSLEEEKARMAEQLAAKEQEKKMLTSHLLQVEDDLRLKNKAFEDLAETLEELKKCSEKAKVNYEQERQHLQKLIEASQQAVSALEEKNETLANEMAKKTEDFLQRISDLVAEKEQLSEQLKLRDSKIEDLSESLSEKTERLQETATALDKTKANLEQTDAQRKKLQQDKKILELLCKKYEGSIEEKDSQIKTVTVELEELKKEHEEAVTDKDGQIKHLQDELAKHEYITGMIHNLTSGKLAPPK